MASDYNEALKALKHGDPVVRIYVECSVCELLEVVEELGMTKRRALTELSTEWGWSYEGGDWVCSECHEQGL